MTLVAEANLFDFFRESVESAAVHTGVRVGDDTRLYLTQLLAERARADRPQPQEVTLAELHARAARAGPAEKATSYRELGDRALICLGLFRRSLERKTVGASYYAEMGAGAYRRADQVFKLCFASAFGDVFQELAAQFDGCVAVLSEIRAAHQRQRAAALALGTVPLEPQLVSFFLGRPADA